MVKVLVVPVVKLGPPGVKGVGWLFPVVKAGCYGGKALTTGGIRVVSMVTALPPDHPLPSQDSPNESRSGRIRTSDPIV